MSTQDEKAIKGVKLTSYLFRDYDEDRPNETLQSVEPYTGKELPGLVMHYGFKSVLNKLSELRMKADNLRKYMFEVTVTVDIGEFVSGRMSEEQLETTRFVHLGYANKDLNKTIEGILGHELKRNETKSIVYSVEDVVKLHEDELFNHMDIIVFPAEGKSHGKPEPMAMLFSTENILGVNVTNPNKGEPFEVALPPSLEAVNA